MGFFENRSSRFCQLTNKQTNSDENITSSAEVIIIMMTIMMMMMMIKVGPKVKSTMLH